MEVVRCAPRKRQTMLFSATFNDQVGRGQPVRGSNTGTMCAAPAITSVFNAYCTVVPPGDCLKSANRRYGTMHRANSTASRRFATWCPSVSSSP